MDKSSALVVAISGGACRAFHLYSIRSLLSLLQPEVEKAPPRLPSLDCAQGESRPRLWTLFRLEAVGEATTSGAVSTANGLLAFLLASRFSRPPSFN